MTQSISSSVEIKSNIFKMQRYLFRWMLLGATTTAVFIPSVSYGRAGSMVAMASLVLMAESLKKMYGASPIDGYKIQRYIFRWVLVVANIVAVFLPHVSVEKISCLVAMGGVVLAVEVWKKSKRN